MEEKNNVMDVKKDSKLSIIILVVISIIPVSHSRQEHGPCIQHLLRIFTFRNDNTICSIPTNCRSSDISAVIGISTIEVEVSGVKVVGEHEDSMNRFRSTSSVR